MYQDYFAGSPFLIWPLVGLALFLVAFAAVLLYVVVGLRNRKAVDRLAGLPLDGVETLTTGAPAAEAEGKVN